jgi:hypothetical protein
MGRTTQTTGQSLKCLQGRGRPPTWHFGRRGSDGPRWSRATGAGAGSPLVCGGTRSGFSRTDQPQLIGGTGNGGSCVVTPRFQKNPRTCRGIRGEQVLGKNPNTSYIGGYAAHNVPTRSTFFQLLRPSNDRAAYRYFIGDYYTSYHRKIQWLQSRFGILLHYVKYVANL